MESITLGDINTFLTLFASILTAGAIICGFALKVGKGVLSKELAPFNKRIDEMDKARTEQHEETKKEINKLKDELHKNSLNTMKNTICNNDLPLSERISVGKDYIDKGGNGAVKILVHTLEEKYEKELNKEEIYE